MRLSHRILSFIAAAAVLALAQPAAAGSVRIEYVRLTQVGAGGGDAPLQPEAMFGFAEVDATGTGAAVQSSQAPACTDRIGRPITCIAHVTGLQGAHLVANAGTAASANGWRIAEGRDAYIPVAPGDRLSILEDATAANGPGVSCSNCATAAGQTTANGSLATIATNTAGVATAANQASANTTLTAIDGHVDQLEGYVDGLEAAIAALPQNNVLAAGSNLVGKVGIDQTTPGTTNQVSAVQNGAWTLQPGNTANTTPWRVNLSDGTNDTSYAASGADDVTNTAAGPRVYARCNIFDGSTWDRCRSMQGAAGDGAGVAATGNYLLKATTYRYATSLTPAATATDIAVLSASATKTVWVTQVCVTGTQTTGGFTPVLLNTHSTLDTGGTGVAISAAKMAQSQSNATATFTRYSANPTVGTVAGALSMKYVMIPAPAGSGANGYCWDFGARGAPVVLAAGSTQELAINLNSQTLSGASITVEMETVEF